VHNPAMGGSLRGPSGCAKDRLPLRRHMGGRSDRAGIQCLCMLNRSKGSAAFGGREPGRPQASNRRAMPMLDEIRRGSDPFEGRGAEDLSSTMRGRVAGWCSEIVPASHGREGYADDGKFLGGLIHIRR